MSLLNVVIGEGMAWLAFDTAGERVHDGERGHWSKAIPLVHAHVILACRGERNFLLHLHLQAALRLGPASFDEFADILPEMLQAASDSYAAQAKIDGAEVASIGIEIVMLGWSDRHGRPACLAAARAPHAAQFEIKETMARVAPGVPVSNLSTIEAMQDLARRQVAAFKPTGQPIGGTLILAELTRDRMAFRRLCDLG